MYDITSVFNYEIIGEMKIGQGTDLSKGVSYLGKADDFFTVEYEMPFTIRSGRHAVLLKYVRPTGRVTGTDIMIIDNITKYGYDQDTEMLTLKFGGHIIKAVAVSKACTDIKPQVVNMLQRDSFFAMLYRGNMRSIADHIRDDLRVFTHGGAVYRTYGAMIIRETLSDDNSIDVPRIDTGVVVLACSDDIPNMEDFYRFYCQFSKLIGVNPESPDEFMKADADGGS